MKLLSLSALSALSLAAGLLGATPALAADGALFAATPSVTVAVQGVESQAQLAQQLSAQGYSNVSLSGTAPNLANPHPELNGATNLASTPVQNGWNGTAQKDGETVQIYATTR
ncbi:hypothetical protein [Acidocella sp.]|uniref:hypothetical protein n=1 Tax=Acidocella sp. TaxID=50710 RepID=UPI0026143FE4|nr:hypothetical protein [Acidocella sp.]